MPTLENKRTVRDTLLPIFTPLIWVYLATLIYIICILSSIAFLMYQPYLGLSLTTTENDKGVKVSAIHTKTTAGKIAIGETIIAITAKGYNRQALHSLSIMEEPDNFKTYREYNQFIDHQVKLYEILSQPVVALELRDGRLLLIEPEKSRPISTFPYQYWILIITAGAGFYIGLWIWIFRRGRIEVKLMALGGFGFMLGACCLAIYTNRELVINPAHYYYVSSINHLGNILFAYSCLILLCYYPSKIAHLPFVLIGSIAIILVWLNETLQWFEIPIHSFYFLPYMASAILGFIIGRWQWLKHKKNPVARASIRWFLLTLTVCIGSALVLYFIPTLFNEPPLLPVWVAQFIILSLYIGLVLGIIQYRLFDVERWWFNCWIWFFSGCCIIAIDIFLIYLFNFAPLKSLSIAVLLTAWCYFPVRQWLWSNTLHPRCLQSDAFFPLLTESYISSTTIKQFEHSWSEILSKIYQPLSIQLYPQTIKSVSLNNHGLSIVLPALNNEQHLVLSGMERGGKLFSQQDVHFIESALAYAQNCITWKNNREHGANQERERIMRDLHDDVGALLLTLVHKAESEENAQLARNALNGVRDTIYSLHDNNMTTLNTALGRWREEIKHRTDAAQVNLQWNIKERKDDYCLTPRQRINLDRILRESISNILKHAQAKTITICMTENSDILEILINDNGISSDPSQWQANTGLYSLHTRAKEINAKITWTSLNNSSTLDKGTTFTITLPDLEKNSHALNLNC